MVTRRPRVLLLVLGAALALATVLLVSQPDSRESTTEVPLSDTLASVEARSTSSPPGLERQPVSVPQRRALLPDASAGDGSARPRQFGTVFLHVIDDSDRAPVPRFEWAREGRVPGMAASDEARGGLARIRVPLDTAAAVRVRAPGYAPSLSIDVSLRQGAVARTVRARLIPEPDGPGVVLTIRDPQDRPVTRVQVVCQSRLAGRSERHGWRVLWRRESNAGNGIHRIALAPAHYHLQVTAIHADGRPMAVLMPQVVRVTVDDGAPTARAVTMSQASRGR